MRHPFLSQCLAVLAVLLVIGLTVKQARAAGCENAPENKEVYWGDMHVHTAYSLDAYGFGTFQSPAEANQFARGGEITMAHGKQVSLSRPLDFVAITDHAEWFDFLYLCTDPEQSDHPDCRILRDKASPTDGLSLFRQFVVPSITQRGPAALDICETSPDQCRQAYLSQWQRVQQQANEANDPCHFTSFIAYEWSATRNFRHTHRNVIFATDQVPEEAFDYIRYPGLQQLFGLLEEHCKPEDGCDVITIPHNTNMGDGTTFDVEEETDRQLALRSRFERLIEVHQEKGNSECLSPLGLNDESDCNFEIRLTRVSRPATVADYTSEEWERMRSTYMRGLLKRGLKAYKRSGANQQNPLQLGVIGSTDGHGATPGFTEEDTWEGPTFGLGSLDAAMSRLDWNPGGLVAVWARENTRAALFDAMKRREVYGTSGTRIRLGFDADTGPISCETSSTAGTIPMGGEFSQGEPTFRIMASKDTTPLARFEIVKGTLSDGNYVEQVISTWEGDAVYHCVTWQDPDFDPAEPAFWYTRILEAPSRRWSSYLCQAQDRCDEFPGADAMTQDRAWSSPIWYLPPQTEE